jgi:hypothetical protein
MKKFILTENEKKQIIKLYGGLISEETETLPSSVVEPELHSGSEAYTKTKELVDGIAKVLDYYEKTSEGKFIDKSTKGEVNLSGSAGYFKSKLDDFKNGITNDKTLEDSVKSDSLKMIDDMINGKFKEYFGDYSSVKASVTKIDNYTGKKRV